MTRKSPYWTDEEMAVVNKAAQGGMARAEAYAILSPRTPNAIDKKIAQVRCGSGRRGVISPTALPANDPGYDDTQEWLMTVDAVQGSRMLLEALARYRVAA